MNVDIPPPPSPMPRTTGKSDQDAQKQLIEDVGNLGTKQLSKEDREKVIGQA